MTTGVVAKLEYNSHAIVTKGVIVSSDNTIAVNFFILQM